MGRINIRKIIITKRRKGLAEDTLLALYALIKLSPIINAMSMINSLKLEVK
jgi:hypothetical protein